MRKQRAFASLTEEEIDQIAEWLRTDTYEFVLERIRQPRPHGYALNISRKPLESLYAKKALLDLINTKVSEDKKLTLAQFESITMGEPLSSEASAKEDGSVTQTHCDAHIIGPISPLRPIPMVFPFAFSIRPSGQASTLPSFLILDFIEEKVTILVLFGFRLRGHVQAQE